MPDSTKEIAQLKSANAELLAAVKALLPCAWGHDKPDCKGDCRTCQAILVARAVISRAEGATP